MFRPCVPVSLCLPFVSLSPCGHFGPWGMGIFRALQFLAFLGLCFGLCGLFSCRVWVCIGSFAFGALWGFCGCYSFCLRAVSTCKGKKALLPLFFALPACLVSSLSLQGLPCLSLCRFILGRYKRKTALCVGRFSLGGCVWFLLLSK